MAAILDLPEVRERMLRLSVDDYERLAEAGFCPRRAELIRGLIVEKMPKSPRHVFLTQLIRDQLRRRLRGGLIIR